MKVLAEVLPPEKVPEGDPWGIPLIFPALVVSLLSLIVVSLLTKPPKKEELDIFFPEKK